MKLLILMSALAVVNSRPQVLSSSLDDQTVQWAFLPIHLQPQLQSSLQLTTPLEILETSSTEIYLQKPQTSLTHIYQKFPRRFGNPEFLNVNAFLRNKNFENLPHLKTNNKVINSENSNARFDVSPSTSSTTTKKPIITSIIQDVRVADLTDARLLKQFDKLSSTEDSFNSGSQVIPYKAHPLFHYLKNKNTYETDKIISFRNEEESDLATLILKPVARAVAGEEGKAIATPLSRAVLRQGTNVDILYEPEAVAIAGPGGIAHAQSDLEIYYDDNL